MHPETAREIRAEMTEIAGGLHELLDLEAPETADLPLRIALVSVLNRVDALVLALPTLGGPPELAARPAKLRDVVEPRGCAVPVRLDRERAAKLCEAALALSEKANETIFWVQAEGEDDEYAAYKRRAGGVMGHLYYELLAPLWRQHPELKPPEMRDAE